MGVPGEIGLVILAADKVYNDPRTTACIASFTNELALDAEETRELCGKPYHYVGYVPISACLDRRRGWWRSGGRGRTQGSHTHTRSMQYPEQVWQGKIEPPKETETDAIEVIKFLDRMEAKHGKKSVMYCRCVSLHFTRVQATPPSERRSRRVGFV